MNKGLIIGLAAILAVFLALPVLGNLGASNGGAGATAEQQAATSEPAPAEQPTAQTQTPYTAQPQAAPGGGQAVTAADLVGTTWKLGDYTVALNAGGRLTVNGSIQGQWSLQGNTLKGSAMGQSVTCTIQNGTLYYEGRPAQRVR